MRCWFDLCLRDERRDRPLRSTASGLLAEIVSESKRETIFDRCVVGVIVL
jgi:hypothetical protein